MKHPSTIRAETILAVDDDPVMLRALERMLRRAGYRVVSAINAHEALDLLDHTCFDLIVTDLAMPGPVAKLLERATAVRAPLVVATGLGRLDEVLGALGRWMPDALLAKPFSAEQLLDTVAAAMSSHRPTATDVETMQLATAMARALALRDVETEAHARRVALWARLLATELGRPPEEVFWCGIGGLLHDVGKIGVPDSILHKPAALDAAEWVVMKRHPELGRDLLMAVPQLAGARDIVLHHHERWDGNGYPSRLAGEAIPLGARIFAIADAYDAITARRPYREPASHGVAVARIAEASGSQFDPRVVDAFRGIDVSRWEAVAALALDPEIAVAEPRVA